MVSYTKMIGVMTTVTQVMSYIQIVDILLKSESWLRMYLGSYFLSSLIRFISILISLSRFIDIV